MRAAKTDIDWSVVWITRNFCCRISLRKRIVAMRDVRSVRADRWLLGSALGLVIALGGCEGGSDTPQTVVPEVPPDVAAKASMNAYKQEHKIKEAPSPKK
jgi:hypothetical protein